MASTGEIDDAIRFGAGLRWSFMGTFLTYTLAGGKAGMRHFMAQFGPALQLPWTYLPAPELTDTLIDRVVEGTSEQQGSRSIAELERYRDDCLLAVLGAIKDTKARHGFAFVD
ncbi:L-carnitine dehydrogenase [compost metagenome]